jgi:hypothetical protein
VRHALRFGRYVGRGRLSAGQQSVLERLERGEITPEEATTLLGGGLRLLDFSIGLAADDQARESTAAESAELSEEEIARRLVERISQEVDAETRG